MIGSLWPISTRIVTVFFHDKRDTAQLAVNYRQLIDIPRLMDYPLRISSHFEIHFFVLFRFLPA
jgi:hypothetical protein